MRQIRVLLTDAQYAFAKEKGRLWLREVIEALRTDGLYPKPKKRWWQR